MFSATKVWRRWHRRIPQNLKRYAICSAIAATAVPALVMARGHRIGTVPEIPLVIQGKPTASTSETMKVLKKFGAAKDVEKAKFSKKLRNGGGKARGRRYVMRKGPLFVYADHDEATRYARNIPGLDVCNVERLNLLELAPGGHMGRFVLWSKNAFDKLEKIYGSQTVKSELKNDYTLPIPAMSNTDVARIINSDEIQKVVRPARLQKNLKINRKKNPLKNLGVKVKLNPYALTLRRAELANEQSRKARAAKLAEARQRSPSEAKLAARAAAHQQQQKTNIGFLTAEEIKRPEPTAEEQKARATQGADDKARKNKAKAKKAKQAKKAPAQLKLAVGESGKAPHTHDFSKWAPTDKKAKSAATRAARKAAAKADEE